MTAPVVVVDGPRGQRESTGAENWRRRETGSHLPHTDLAQGVRRDSTFLALLASDSACGKPTQEAAPKTSPWACEWAPPVWYAPGPTAAHFSK